MNVYGRRRKRCMEMSYRAAMSALQHPTTSRHPPCRGPTWGETLDLNLFSPCRSLVHKELFSNGHGFGHSVPHLSISVLLMPCPPPRVCAVCFSAVVALTFVPVVINFPIDVFAHARFLKIINEQRNDKAFLV